MTPEEYREQAWRRRLAKSQIPTRFWGKTIDKLDRSEGVDEVAEYIDQLTEHREAGTGLLLVGPPGRGKTTLASVVGLHAFERGYSAYYTTLADYKSLLLDEMKLSTAIGKVSRDVAADLVDEWEYKRAVLERIQKRVVFLLIDDVGKEHKTDTAFIENAFDQLFRSRFDRGLPTVLTTNLPVPQWAKTYSESMASFVKEACVIVAVDGEDRRKKR